MVSTSSGIEERLAKFKATFVPWQDPYPVLRAHSRQMDNLLWDLFEDLASSSLREGMTLVAVGGYGREELTPWSDVDLMFLCEETSSQEVLEVIYRILHSLWDLHLEVGHSVRTVKDCIDVALRDIPTWTALLDARYIVGDLDLFRTFEFQVKQELLSGRKERFLKTLVGSVRERHRSHSRSPFLTEPHVKNGPGGLRDYQSALWLARAVFPVKSLESMVVHSLVSQKDAQEIEEAVRFLWQVRLEMHRAAGRKEDHLTFDLQERIAETFPRPRPGKGLVEEFMREYYRHATTIRYLVEDCIQKVTDPSLGAGPKGPSYVPQELGLGFQVMRGRLTVVDEKVFENDPPRLMEALSYSHRKGIPLDLFTRDEIKSSVHLVDANFRRSRRVRDAFLSILETGDCGYGALELMHRLGLLQAYIPEFQRICFEVQYDAYHAYTVDVHSLETVRELGAMRMEAEGSEDSSIAKAARAIQSWSSLVLAALLHDIGKGDGPGHAQRGAHLAEAIMDRWWMPQREKERVVFLVREHVTMMDTALSRDLTEEKVVVDLCRLVGSVERLSELYLLTIADLKATGPDVLTQWKEQLLEELYLKSYKILEMGDLVSPEMTTKVREMREYLRSSLSSQLSHDELEEWIEALPSRYLLTTSPERLLDQLTLAREMKEKGMAAYLKYHLVEDKHEILVCTWDRPGLFSSICAVMLAHGLNIVEARIHTWTNAVAMDTFTVEPLGAESREPMDPQKIAEMERDLRAILEGTLSVKELLSKRIRPPLGAHRAHSQIKPRVTIDNRASDFYTVVEIRAADRLGLLFAVTSALAKLELGVHVAIVDTRKGRVIDVFYVQDSGGQKILEKEKLSQIEATLYGVLERLETVGPWAFLE